MGWTSENVALEFNITREEQDAFAASSFQKAEDAQKKGYFAKEIVPFTVFQKQANSDTPVAVAVKEDDGIRYGTTAEKLAKIKGAFPQWGNSTTTGGNASQITDGAAAVLVMTRQEAEKRGLSILAKFITTAVSGKIFLYLETRQSEAKYRGGAAYYGNWTCLCHPTRPQERWLGTERC